MNWGPISPTLSRSLQNTTSTVCTRTIACFTVLDGGAPPLQLVCPMRHSMRMPSRLHSFPRHKLGPSHASMTNVWALVTKHVVGLKWLGWDWWLVLGSGSVAPSPPWVAKMAVANLLNRLGTDGVSCISTEKYPATRLIGRFYDKMAAHFLHTRSADQGKTEIV